MVIIYFSFRYNFLLLFLNDFLSGLLQLAPSDISYKQGAAVCCLENACETDIAISHLIESGGELIYII